MKELFTEKTRWCWHPEIPNRIPCFVYFRRTFAVNRKNCRLKLDVSADNRYNLSLDGRIIGRGPCRSDLQNYNFESYDVDISPGEHVLAADVVVFGEGCAGNEIAIAEMHWGSGFLAAGGIFHGEEKIVNLETLEGWKCIEDKSRTHRSLGADGNIRMFNATPPMEKLDCNLLVPGIHSAKSTNDGWHTPMDFGPVILRDTFTLSATQWWLIPRQIPMMEEKAAAIKSVFRTEGIDADLAGKWLSDVNSGRNAQLKILPGRSVKMVFDAGTLTTAFPELVFKGAKGATIKITYSESLFVNGIKLERNHRDGIVLGYSDLIVMSDSEAFFQPFWFRTFRFLEIEVKNNARSPVILKKLSSTSFMYPFKLKAAFECGDNEVGRIWEIAWRTARLCANEHYYDCPYYEQLQYVGDTRIQALISYAATGDGRLGRQAILQYDWSRLPEGITQSRYPSNWKQIIVGFSLYWVMMVKDYHDYFGDEELVRMVFPGIKQVLDWFERRRIENGLVGHLPFWNFTDWLNEWPGGNPDRNSGNPITINTLQYAEACRTAAYLATKIGDRSAKEFTTRYRTSIEAANRFCYCREKQLYSDMPGTGFFSQHTNAWAIISGAIKGRMAAKLASELIENKDLSKTTLYFSFYLFRAWALTGHYNNFWKQLDQWRSVLKWDFTTFPEIPSPGTRSDCHAWSASPIFELLTGVLGIKPGKPGFKSLLIEPKFCGIVQAEGKAPVGDQIVAVSWKITKKDEVVLKVSLEKPLPITVRWPDGKIQKLGKTKFATLKHQISGQRGSCKSTGGHGVRLSKRFKRRA